MSGSPVSQLFARPSRARWSLSLYRDAGEAGGCFVPAARGSGYRGVAGAAVDPERSRAEAARRARGQVRRYCAANGLNRFGTLTFAGAGCFDERQLRVHVADFFRCLRRGLGGAPLAYLWVPEWHKTHGLHAHFAVGRYVRRSLIVDAWGRGLVHIKLLGDLPVGSGTREQARVAARYLGKYVGKAFERGTSTGLHRYEVGQGFAPRVTRLGGVSLADVTAQACALMGGPPARQWTSDEATEWKAPPAVWLSWD